MRDSNATPGIDWQLLSGASVRTMQTETVARKEEKRSDNRIQSYRAIIQRGEQVYETSNGMQTIELP